MILCVAVNMLITVSNLIIGLEINNVQASLGLTKTYIDHRVTWLVTSGVL